MEFRRDINGLRAIAVISVVFFHFGVRFFDGGYVGVDVFFVISGFLLTSIAHRRIQAGQFSPVQFLLNRLRRIYPALLVTVIACCSWAALSYLPDDFSRLVRNGTASLLFRSNYAFLSDVGGYFAPDARANIFLHTWSLAVESQFYLLFAFTCALFWPSAGRGRKTAGWVAFGVLAVVSLAWCIARTPAHQASTFYMLWGRAWEFMAGSVAALIATRPARKTASLLSVVGAVLLLAAVLGFHGDDAYPGWRAVLPVAGTALMIYAGEGVVARVLSSWPLQFLGSASYSIYLWHWPILVGFRERTGAEPTGWQIATLIAASVIVGWVSYLLVEQPSRKRLRNTAIGAVFVLSVGAGFGFTAVLNKTEGLQGRLPSYLRAASDAMKSDAPRAYCMRDVDGTKHTPGDFCTLGGMPANEHPVMMLWGDSFANMIQPVVDRVSAETHTPGIVATLGGCPPFKGKVFPGSGAEVFPGCEHYANFAFDYFMRTPSIKLVVVAGDWQRYEPTYEGGVLKDIASTLATRGGRLVLVKAVPNPRGDGPRVWARAQFAAGHEISQMSVPRAGQADIEERGKQIARLPLEVGNVTTVDPFEALCSSIECFTVKGGVGLFKDTDHLSQNGVKAMAPLLANAIRKQVDAIGK
ncbi:MULTISPECIES: acyltransferase family protein [unclassified Caballeronia]|uniref:acyltransferase family protein n=1 Tax=unclassified Caballeronia TaxID=2646786 RepID=UPI002865EAB1|nr:MULTISPECIES: acyltransferase family protein [unclassified Caballeronia]MDR5777023.1 acyltransferase family protein [Caballeronia sp. LZ002]MDR5852402.1 acyltransferase family protein [Caballeronia sp. LZ003]